MESDVLSILIPVILGAVIFFFERLGAQKKKKPDRVQQPRRVAAQQCAVGTPQQSQTPAKRTVKPHTEKPRVEEATPQKPAPFLEGETTGRQPASVRSMDRVPATIASRPKPAVRNLRAAIIWGEILKRKF